jgi:hypothetical protein
MTPSFLNTSLLSSQDNSLSWSKSRAKVINEIYSREMSKSLENLLQGERCIICQDSYSYRESISHLNCDHVFHTQCIATWLKVHTKTYCPCCKSCVDIEELKQLKESNEGIDEDIWISNRKYLVATSCA